jgi:hypothetical protein
MSVSLDCTRLESLLSSLRHGLDHFSVRVSSEVDNVARGEVFLRGVGFALSVSFHQCSIPIFIYLLLLDQFEKKTPENLPTRKVSFGNWKVLGSK